MQSADLVSLLVSLGVLLWTARLFGEIARHFGQVAVLGELLAGVMLGPTVLGKLAPEFSAWLFSQNAPLTSFNSGFATLSAVLLLFVAGSEIQLKAVKNTGSAAFWVSGFGMVIPFTLGGAIAWYFPQALGFMGTVEPARFALFFATAMSISALPVIAKTLLDLGIYHTRVGLVSMSSAVIDDVVGWILFSVVLSHVGGTSANGFTVALAGRILFGAILFATLMLTVGTYLFNRVLPFLKAWSNKMLSFCLGFALLGAAMTEMLGVHALLGAFITGVALGNAKSFDDETRETTRRFVNSFFGPLFIAGLGLRTDFIADFKLPLVVIVLLIACSGKIAGCLLAGKIAGLAPQESRAVALAMNARGAMEIILGAVALQFGLIGKPLYVALVVMALVTSAMAGAFIPKRGLN